MPSDPWWSWHTRFSNLICSSACLWELGAPHCWPTVWDSQPPHTVCTVLLLRESVKLHLHTHWPFIWIYPSNILFWWSIFVLTMSILGLRAFTFTFFLLTTEIDSYYIKNMSKVHVLVTIVLVLHCLQWLRIANMNNRLVIDCTLVCFAP